MERIGETASEIQTLEELSMRAWPALETLADDGWVHRFSGGYTRRANSVHPLASGTRRLVDKVDEAESLYRARNLPTIFKLTADSQPDGLESALVGRGYIEEARTAVHVADVASGEEDVAVETKWSRARSWSDGFHHMSNIPHERRILHDKILSSISLPTGFVWVEENGRIVGCGLGVVERDWLGIFDIVVAPEVRRRGIGERLTRGAIAWGHKMGARKAYLQVMSDNAPAVSLYDKLGFHEAYQYWYRVRRTDVRAQGELASGDSTVDLSFTYQGTQGGDVLIRRGGCIVTHLRNDAARQFIVDVDGACFEEQQLLMARVTGNYKRGNERRAEEHPRRRGRT